MRLLFDLYATQAVGRIKYNGGSEYVKRLFTETIDRRDDSVKLFCTYHSRYPLDDFLRQTCLKEGVVLLDVSKLSIDEYVLQENIDQIFLGVIQHYGKLEFNKNVKVVIVCHDIRNLEVFPTRVALWYLSDFVGFKNKLTVIL